MRVSVSGWKSPFLFVSLLVAFGLAHPFLAAGDAEEQSAEEITEKTAGDQAEHHPPAADAGETPQLPIRILGNYFFHFPGLQTFTLTPFQRERFLQRVNKELCNCGTCSRDTVANCYINDPRCRNVRDQAALILNEVRAGQ